MDSRPAAAVAATITPNKFFSGTMRTMVFSTKKIESLAKSKGVWADTRGRVA